MSADEGTNSAVMVTEPDDLGVNVTMHVPDAKVQFAVVLRAPDAVN